MYLGEAMNSFATGVQSGYAFVDNAMNDKQEREAKQLEAKQVAEARAQQIRASQQAVSASEQTQDRLNATETAKMQAIEAIRQDNVGKEIPKLTQQWALGTVNNKDIQNYLANEPYAQKMLGLKDIKSIGEFNQSALDDTTSREYEYMAQEAKYAVDQWKAQVAQGQDGDTEVLGLDAMNTSEQDIVKAYADHFKSIYKQADGQPLNLNSLAIATGAPTKTLSASQRDMEMQLAGLTESWGAKMTAGALVQLKHDSAIALEKFRTENDTKLANQKNKFAVEAQKTKSNREDKLTEEEYKNLSTRDKAKYDSAYKIAEMKANEGKNTAHMKNEKWDRERLTDSIGSRYKTVDSADEDIDAYIVAKESKGDYNAQNPTSTAFGKYQVIDSTRRDVANKLGLTEAQSKTPEGQEKVYTELKNGYRSLLRKLDEPITAKNMYAVHQLGTGRAERYFKGTLTAKDLKVMKDNLPKSKQDTKDVVGEWTRTYGDTSRPTRAMIVKEADTLGNSDIMTTQMKKEVEELRGQATVIPALRDVQTAMNKPGVKTGYLDNTVKWLAERSLDGGLGIESLVGMDLEATAEAEQLGGIEGANLLKVLSGASATDGEFQRTINNIIGDKNLDEKAKSQRIKTYLNRYVTTYSDKVRRLRNDLPVTAFELDAYPATATQAVKPTGKKHYKSFLKKGGK